MKTNRAKQIAKEIKALQEELEKENNNWITKKAKEVVSGKEVRNAMVSKIKNSCHGIIEKSCHDLNKETSCHGAPSGSSKRCHSSGGKGHCQ